MRAIPYITINLQQELIVVISATTPDIDWTPQESYNGPITKKTQVYHLETQCESFQSISAVINDIGSNAPHPVRTT